MNPSYLFSNFSNQVSKCISEMNTSYCCCSLRKTFPSFELFSFLGADIKDNYLKQRGFVSMSNTDTLVKYSTIQYSLCPLLCSFVFNVFQDANFAENLDF